MATTRYDRNQVLDGVDLERLADEFLGPRRGTHRSGTWRCPDPGHAQTGRTPPLSVFNSRRGEQRWRCHGCGAGGTAIDLYMLVTGCDTRTAIDELAHRAGACQQQPAGDHHRPAPAAAPANPEALHRYVGDCAARLWRPSGEQVRSWLTSQRRLPEAVLRRNLVGADPGPHVQDRPDGTPKAGLAAVLPAVEQGHTVYLQLRRLRPKPDQPRYLNPSSTAAANPRIARFRAIDPASPIVLVTEGPIDALSANAAGYHAVALLGASSADATAARRLAACPGQLVIAFDNDDAGARGADRLASILTELDRRPGVLQLPDGLKDLNDWLVQDPDIARRLSQTLAGLARGPTHGMAIH